MHIGYVVFLSIWSTKVCHWLFWIFVYNWNINAPPSMFAAQIIWRYWLLRTRMHYSRVGQIKQSDKLLLQIDGMRYLGAKMQHHWAPVKIFLWRVIAADTARRSVDMLNWKVFELYAKICVDEELLFIRSNILRWAMAVNYDLDSTWRTIRNWFAFETNVFKCDTY